MEPMCKYLEGDNQFSDIVGVGTNTEPRGELTSLAPGVLVSVE